MKANHAISGEIMSQTDNVIYEMYDWGTAGLIVFKCRLTGYRKHIYLWFRHMVGLYKNIFLLEDVASDTRRL